MIVDDNCKCYLFCKSREEWYTRACDSEEEHANHRINGANDQNKHNNANRTQGNQDVHVRMLVMDGSDDEAEEENN